MQAHGGVDGLSVDNLFETQKFLKKTKSFAKCEKIYKAKEKNQRTDWEKYGGKA